MVGVAAALAGCRDSGGSAPSSTSADSGAKPTTGSGAGPSTGSPGTDPGSGSGSGEFAGLEFVDLELDGDWGMVTDFRFLPQRDELLMLEKSGRVGHLRLQGDRLELLGSFQVGNIYSVLDCGLISLALDPQFDSNGLLYIGLCSSEQESEIRRYTFDASDYASVPATEALILNVGDPEAPKPWHNVGSIGFEADGVMWALFGDKKVADNGQDRSNPLSALVRLIPERAPDRSGYEPAPDNPFQGENESPLVYAWGLRSPWKGVRDSQGRYWFGDVGANAVEEINVIDGPGQNFGWPLAEGPCTEDCQDLVDPVTFWPHDGVHRYAVEDEDVVPTNARVAYVGLEVRDTPSDPYRGALTGRVLLGDYCQGYVRAAALEDGALVEDRHLGHLHVPSAWAQGTDGFVYAATFGKCETPSIDENDPPPSRFVRAVPVFE